MNKSYADKLDGNLPYGMTEIGWNELMEHWGGRWDSNPRISEPQSEALTAWRHPPPLIAF